jgi:hypothetical protein
MKTTIQFLVSALVLCLSSLASAQAIPEQSVQLSPKMAACLRSCMTQGAAPAATPSCNGLTDAERAKIAKMAADIAVMKGQIAGHTAQIAEIKKRLAALDEKDADHDAKLAQLRKDLDALLKVVESLEKSYGLLLQTVVLADNKLGADILQLQNDMKALDQRVSDLEGRSVKIGPRVGVLVLPALDGSVYSGLPVVARLVLPLGNKRTWLAFDGGAAFSGSDSPVGAYGRAGVGYDFHPNWYVTGGVGTLWAGYNDKLKATAAYVPFDGGFGFRYGVFDASLNVLAGPKFGKDGTSLAIGGAAMAGFNF